MKIITKYEVKREYTEYKIGSYIIGNGVVDVFNFYRTTTCNVVETALRYLKKQGFKCPTNLPWRPEGRVSYSHLKMVDPSGSNIYYTYVLEGFTPDENIAIYEGLDSQ